MTDRPHRVAIVGAGMAGATAARFLADSGWEVCVLDKSRGVGGRMATRRAPWRAADGVEHIGQFDHGAPGFTVSSAEFTEFVEQVRRDGLLARWAPRMAPGSYEPLGGAGLWVATPDMPALCRALLSGLQVRTGVTVDSVQRSAAGWRLVSTTAEVIDGFEAVILAIPAPQAAPLVQPHRTDWAERARGLPMLPTWTLMATASMADPQPAWDLAWPSAGQSTGPISVIVRNDAKPGRVRTAGLAQWVVHARADWSQTHLEAPPAAVHDELQAALTASLAEAGDGRSIKWEHTAVHRWRYATSLRAASSGSPCWWDADLTLGVCGDAVGGGGVEGAWLSGRALAASLVGYARAVS